MAKTKKVSAVAVKVSRRARQVLLGGGPSSGSAKKESASTLYLRRMHREQQETKYRLVMGLLKELGPEMGTRAVAGSGILDPRASGTSATTCVEAGCDSPHFMGQFRCTFHLVVELLKEIEPRRAIEAVEAASLTSLVCSSARPLPLLLWCPQCFARHIDEGEFERREHRTHECSACGFRWAPSSEPTVGVKRLPPAGPLPPTDAKGKGDR